jgi:lipoprotein-releasing system ATP-binding protein
MSTILQLTDIRKGFAQGAVRLHILNGLNLVIKAGEVVALVGPSGSGKTTLLQIAGLLAQPDEGKVEIQGQACEKLGDAARTALRREKIGFVYQFHHLLPELSAKENVMMPQLISGKTKAQASEEAKRLLGLVGLSARISHRPAELSGGEQQRVAMARALANRPALVLADEPTGNLDPETSAHVFAMFRDTLRETQSAALIVTHNHELARSCDRLLRLEQGKTI